MSPREGVSMSQPIRSDRMPRRRFLQAGAAGLLGVALGPASRAQQPAPEGPQRPTQFQIACMTLPYSAYPLERALSGLQGAGYRHVAWGTTHTETGGQRVPILAADAP